MEELFKWFTSEEDETYARVAWFAESFREDAFQGVEKLLFLFLVYCTELGVIAKREYLVVFLNTEGKVLIKKHNIKVDALALMNYDEPGSLEEAYQILQAETLTLYDRMCLMDLEGHVFKVDAKAFIEKRKNLELQQLFAKYYPILIGGQSSATEVLTVMEDRLMNIGEDYSVDKLDDLDFISGKTSRSDETKEHFVAKTSIPCIDNDMGGTFTKQVWTFTGGPGTGKSRFAFINIAYETAVVYKQGVLISELELTKSQVENILIAHHIAMLYKIKIPDKLMNRGELDPQQKRYYDAARIDLFESGKYGRIIITDDDLPVETLPRKMLQFFRLNRDIKAWIVDYLGILSSKPTGKYDKRKERYEIISDGLISIRKVAKRADVFAFCICQFNDEGIKANEIGKPIRPGMVEGGHIIQRHSDYDLVMTMTPEQKLARMRSLSSVKLRSATGFENIPIQTDLSVSIFKQVANTTV